LLRKERKGYGGGRMTSFFLFSLPPSHEVIHCLNLTDSSGRNNKKILEKEEAA